MDSIRVEEKGNARGAGSRATLKPARSRRRREKRKTRREREEATALRRIGQRRWPQDDDNG